MRLAIVRQRYTPYGGAERFVERALAALAARGVELTLVTRRWPDGGDPRIVPLVVAPPYVGRTLRDAGFARAACAALARLPETLVQSHERLACCDLYRAGDGVHASWVDERLRHASAADRLVLAASPYHRYVMAAERRMFASRRLQAVICISRMVQGEIHERFGLPLDRLPIIYNAIDPARFHPGLAASREATRMRHGIPAEACVFLLVGSEYARKGVRRALEALVRVPAPAHLVVVGRDRHPQRYAALARRLGVAARVTFAGAQDDPRPFYGAADAFVLPTLYDALSNAVLEALACGLPVVTSERCGAGELVGEHGAGFVVGARDIDAIAASMHALLDPGVRARMATQASAAMADLTPPAMAARLVALYERLLPTVAGRAATQPIPG
ncbi:MAG: glycosyltransferase family 4 protein [Burkholderiales bacterium]|nr:glycosyltransferase family 4 protein [Burkholderiales bacterium]